MIKAVALVTLLSCLWVSPSSAQLCGEEESVCYPGFQAVYVPCWGACLEYLSCEYNWHFSQIDFGVYACLKRLSSCPSCDCYDDIHLPCRRCSTTQNQIFTIADTAGFHLDPRTLQGKLTENAAVNTLCSALDHWHIMIFLLGAVPPGHVMVINQYEPATGEFYVMDPIDGYTYGYTYAELDHHIDYGEWKHSMTISGWAPSRDFLNNVGIGDIASFGAYPHSYDMCQTSLRFSIIETADPDERSAVYIADNPLGPARLIQSLVDYPLLEPQVNIWSDRWRYCDSECEYYYFMDHSLADPFPEVRKVATSELKPSSTNPYYFSGHDNGNRPVFDPPSQVTVSDIPLDPGNMLRIDWDVSAQDDTIDCYNIYRWEADSPGATVEDYIYLTSVPKGTSSYVDTTVQYFRYYSYMVSAAHHGYYQTIPYGKSQSHS